MKKFTVIASIIMLMLFSGCDKVKNEDSTTTTTTTIATQTSLEESSEIVTDESSAATPDSTDSEATTTTPAATTTLAPVTTKENTPTTTKAPATTTKATTTKAPATTTKAPATTTKATTTTVAPISSSISRVYQFIDQYLAGNNAVNVNKDGVIIRSSNNGIFINFQSTSKDYLPTDKEVAAYLTSVNVTSGTSVHTSSAGNVTYEIKLIDGWRYNYSYRTGTTRKLYDYEIKNYNKAKQILGTFIKADMTPYQKELAVHDWMALNTKFDYDNFLAGTIPDSSSYPEGLLFNNLAACNGYATSFKLFMDIIGIECKYVRNSTHAWNAVKLDGEWYWVDPTWDDPAPDKAGKVRHNYFNVTDAVLKLDHTFNELTELDGIKCTATKYNYFVMSNLYANNMDELKKLTKSEIDSGKKTIYIMYKGTLDKKSVNFIFDYTKSFSYLITPQNSNTLLKIEIS